MENTNNKTYLFNALITHSIVLLLSFMFLLNCGSSRQAVNNDSINIDELLGEEENIQAERTNSDEAEVLKLLGITPAEDTATPQTADVSMADNKAGSEKMEGDLTLLRDDLVKKEQEISDLRSELTKKEMKISELESRTGMNRSGSVRKNGPIIEPSFEFRNKYQQALSQFKERNYQSAIPLLNELILSDPNNSLSDNCQYWIGECYYGLINYNQAIAEFEKVFSFANSNKSDDAQLKLGICYLRLGDKAQARAEFDRLLSVYPSSEYNTLAQKYIARL